MERHAGGALENECCSMTKRVAGRRFLQACALGVCALSLGACGRTRSLDDTRSSAGSAGLEPSAGAGGGGGASSTTGTAGVPVNDLGGAAVCSKNGVTCLDALTAQYCEVGQPFVNVECKVGMAAEGFISLGCESNAEGAGCTVDGFLDLDCERGTPNFTACRAGTAEDLLDVYAACFSDFEGANAIVSCYAGFMDETGTLVDCGAAHAACSRP
mgnify:FL=1